ncbi:MAG: antibiotic biosynthesis monooxygenase [Planctomycetes bacterium]|nr:antibiotic biosynthesis monooxygenase [Planctomycetota bacterium]
MVTVGMNYHVLEGKGEMFEGVFNKVIEIMNKIDGHVKTDLFSKIEDRNCYLIMSEWSDRSAFDGFIASEQFRNVANWGKEEVLAGRPSHEYYGADAAPSQAAPSQATQGRPSGGGCPVAHS